MEIQNDFVAIKTQVPTYLSELLQTNEDIILVYSEKKNEDLFTSTVENNNVSLDTSGLNLTGTPLHVDLSILPATYNNISKKLNKEAQHFPIKLDLARKIIIEQHKAKVTLPNAIHCICDGSDDENTIVLGCQLTKNAFVRTLVFAQSSVDESYPQNNMDNMLKCHFKNAGMAMSKVATNVTSFYELYGHTFNDSQNVEETENNVGSALLKASWTIHEYNIPPFGATMKLMLQSIVGHKESIVHRFFTDLSCLSSCLTVVSQEGNVDEMTISANPLDAAYLIRMITNIFNELNIIRKHAVTPNNIEDAVQNVNEVNFTHKLWSLLKCCETVNDLKDCLKHVFETINDQPANLKLFESDNNTMIGKIMNNIYSGRMIVPCLSSKQSLELFIELGLQKMKETYFAVIKSYNFSIGQQLLEEWNKIGKSVCETRRGTFVELNFSQGLVQLRFLFFIHVLLEFLQLVELKCSFSKDISVVVLTHAYKKYFTETSSYEPPTTLEETQLHDLIVPLTFSDIKSVQDYIPSKWQIKMISAQKDSSVITMFHYSKKPVFPSTIYKYEDTNESSSDVLEETYFVTQVETYSDRIC